METAEGLNKNALIKEQEPAKTQPGQALSEPCADMAAENSSVKLTELNGSKTDVKSQNLKGAVKSAGEEKEVRGEKLGGKFKDVKALLDAYNSLQSVFTERSRKLKELEREKVNANAQTIDDLQSSGGNLLEKIVGKNKLTDEETSRLKSTAGTFDCDEGIGLVKAYVKMLEDKLKDGEKYSSREYILQKINEDRALKDEVIKNYLGDIVAKKPDAILLSGGGQGVYAPPLKPNSLAEAGEIARQIFINQENTKW